MLQFKEGINIDLQQSEKVKVMKDDFEQALLDVKPVGVGSCDLVLSLCHCHPQAFGVSNEQLDTYIINGTYRSIDEPNRRHGCLDVLFTGIIEWSPIIEQILERGRMAIKQTEHDKFTTLTSLLIHGMWLGNVCNLSPAPHRKARVWQDSFSCTASKGVWFPLCEDYNT